MLRARGPRRKRQERASNILTWAKQSSSYSVNLGLGSSSREVEKAGELKVAIDGATRAVNDGKIGILSLV